MTRASFSLEAIAARSANYLERLVDALGPEQIRAYQVHLIEERKLAAGSLSVVAAALRFLYKITLRRPWNDDDIPMPKRPLKLPIVLSPEEVVRFLDGLSGLDLPKDMRETKQNWRSKYESSYWPQFLKTGSDQPSAGDA